jgi:hypothetical protein
MPDSHGVVFPRMIERHELGKFVEELGGDWQDEPVFPQGVIVEGDARLYICGIDCQTDLLEMLDPDEIKQAEHVFGAPPAGALEVHHTRGDKGNALAAQVMKKMVALWGGIVRGGLVRGCDVSSD